MTAHRYRVQKVAVAQPRYYETAKAGVPQYTHRRQLAAQFFREDADRVARHCAAMTGQPHEIVAQVTQ